MLNQDSTITFIGGGAMGGAMIRGILKQQHITPTQITLADPDATKAQSLVNELGITYNPDNIQATRGAQILMLAVKPQVMPHVLANLKGQASHLALIISIAAGITIETIATALDNPRIVRAMPNTPAQIGQGMTVWTATPQVTREQREQARQMLASLGEELFVHQEDPYIDMATALSGSGPAYAFLMVEALIDAGVRMGFHRQHAEQLATQTMLGALQYLKTTGEHPAILRNQVTSPGGTTAAGLHELERGALRAVIADAVWSAYQRAVQLGKKP